MNGILSDVILEMGYDFTASVEDCRNALVHFGLQELKPSTIARMLVAMIKTHSNLTENTRIYDSNGIEMTTNDDRHSSQTWNVDTFVIAINDLMEKYPLLQTTLLFYYNNNWKTPKDRLIVFVHYFMINYGYRIFIDKTTTAEILKLEHDDIFRFVYTKNQEVIFTTHRIADGCYKLRVKIDNTEYEEESFDLKMHLGLQCSSNSPIEIDNLDKFAQTVIRIINDLNNYVEVKKKL